MSSFRSFLYQVRGACLRLQRALFKSTLPSASGYPSGGRFRRSGNAVLTSICWQCHLSLYDGYEREGWSRCTVLARITSPFGPGFLLKTQRWGWQLSMCYSRWCCRILLGCGPWWPHCSLSLDLKAWAGFGGKRSRALALFKLNIFATWYKRDQAEGKMILATRSLTASSKNSTNLLWPPKDARRIEQKGARKKVEIGP